MRTPLLAIRKLQETYNKLAEMQEQQFAEARGMKAGDVKPAEKLSGLQKMINKLFVFKSNMQQYENRLTQEDKHTI